MKRTEAARENFDAEMVVIADGEFKFDRQFHSMLQARGSGDIRSVDSMLPVRAIEKRASLVKMEAEAKSGLESARRKSSLFNRQLKAVVGKEMAEIILEGRLKVAFLIDSNGGDVVVFDIYNQALKSVAERGGLSQAYVTGTAASAAFDLMAVAQQSYVLEKTSLMWHHSTDEKGLAEEDRKAEIALLNTFLDKGRGKALRKIQKRVWECIDDDENADSRMFFSGEELTMAGCVTGEFDDLAEMKRFFNAQYLLARQPQVKNFWTLTRRILQPVEGLPSWHDPAEKFEQTRKFYKIQEGLEYAE